MPLPDDMDALADGLLTDADMAPDSAFCSRAFQSELQAFLRAQVILLPCHWSCMSRQCLSHAACLQLHALNECFSAALYLQLEFLLKQQEMDNLNMRQLRCAKVPLSQGSPSPWSIACCLSAMSSSKVACITAIGTAV